MDNTVTKEPICYINGKRHVLPLGAGERTLLSYLRECRLTGTKLGCGEGGCGACTVMVSTCSPDGSLKHIAVNACLCPLYSIEGAHVVTVEGIGNPRDGLHPVQMRLSKAHGSQCGFCTPGFVMSMYALLRGAEGPISEGDVEEALAGNLCRCTGYRPILDAFRAFTEADVKVYSEEAIAAAKGIDMDQGNGTINGAADASYGNGVSPANGARHSKEVGTVALCPSTGLVCSCAGASESPRLPSNGVGSTAGSSQSCSRNKLGDEYGGVAPGAVRSEPIFPPELRRRSTMALNLPGPKATWLRPLSLDSLLAIKAAHPEAKLVVGNTEVGIEMKFKATNYPVLVGTTHVRELTHVEFGENGVTFGASVSLTDVRSACQQLVASKPAHMTCTFAAIAEQLQWFAGAQVRNVACLGGNICTASPISDLNPIWMASRTAFLVSSAARGAREIMASEFFVGYRKTLMEPDEVLVSVFVPFNRPREFISAFKQAHRRDDDIAIVNAGLRIQLRHVNGGFLEKEGQMIEDVQLAFGGVAPKTVMAPKTAQVLKGARLCRKTLDAALAELKSEIWVAPGAPGGMSEYRGALAAGFLFKFLVGVGLRAGVPETEFPSEWAPATEITHRPPSMGVQFHAKAPPSSIVGAPLRHAAADLQVCGEAKYTDDIELPSTALHAALVLSSVPHARLLGLDAAEACKMPGVAGFFSAADVPGSNMIGPVAADEEVFATSEITAVGQVLGIIVAETEEQARAAAKAVEVRLEELPSIMSCEEAVAAGSFFEGSEREIAKGDVDAAFATGGFAHVLEGTVKMGGQEHFYLEPHVSLVLPQEDDEYVLVASTQAPSKHQKTIAKVLGLPESKLVAKTKRLGGGFGGKETRSVFLHAAASIPAYHLRRAVRLCLDRDEDMQATGQRHAFLGTYKVGTDAGGRVLALDLQLYNNAGNSLDLSASIMERALLHADGAYDIPAMRVRGRLCRTNQASNTAFRGFGGPQGMLATEMWMDAIAGAVSKPAEEVRRLNFYKEGALTHYGQRLDLCQLGACWDATAASADFGRRRAEVAAFNAKSRFRKRGLALMPTKFGISFTAKFLNQAGALIHIYTDGTVLVTHGGVEMGQGLHTKMAQVAAEALRVPADCVHVAETSTDKVPNASPTAASASSDMYGGAVADACAQLNARLEPFRAAASPSAGLKELATAAYMARVDLSAHGFYATPDVTGFGGDRPFNYFCYGAAAAEVEVDCLTGDMLLRRADVTMDVGNPINPAIDIGQVEGGFIQGMGWTCLEELVWGDDQHEWVPRGTLFTRGPGTYKIPTVNDIPVDLRVTLLQGAPNPRAIHSSKAVGEPPFHLGASVFFAVKDAIGAARESAGLPRYVAMDSPATPERIRMACPDFVSKSYAAADTQPKISC